MGKEGWCGAEVDPLQAELLMRGAELRHVGCLPIKAVQAAVF